MCSCWECKETCNTCTKPIFGVCWIEEWTCISVQDVTQVWQCCKVYKISNTMTLSSSDNSITINKVWCNYDIKAKTNSTVDKLVSVNGLDTAWYLVDKIKDCWNWVVSVQPRQISPGNWIIEICWNPSTGWWTVTTTDERVAFKSWCTADFLAWQLEAWNCIEVDKSWCKAIFNLKDCCFTKPEWTITVNTAYEINIQHNAPVSLQSYAIDGANTSWTTNWWTWISVVSLSLSWWNVDWLQLAKAGRYRVSYTWQSWISNWVSWAFVNIYASTLASPVLSVWYEAPQWRSLTPYNPVDALSTMDPLDMESRLFSWSIDVTLPANSVLYIWWEVRTNVTTWNGAWNRWCIMVQPKSTLSVEWISDSTWIFRHTTC